MQSKYPDATKGEIKALMQAVLATMLDQAGEERPKELSDIPVDDDDADGLVAEDQPAAGLFLKCEAWGKPTESGGVYTKYRWDVLSADEYKRAEELKNKVL